MLIPGCAEKEMRATANDYESVLSPLHVLLASPGGEPREMKCLEAVDRVARSHDPVWIVGEVGAGAAWLAQMIHDRSPHGGIFTREDCEAGHPPALFEGHGSLLLCSPERLSLDHQESVLSYLQRTDMRHLEGLRTMPAFPRVMAWSLTSVATLSRNGQILPALAHALGRIQITIPPLRAQRESLDTFARAMLEQIAAHEGLALRHLTPDAMAALRAYPWPGNLTELNSLLERACLLADPDQTELTARDLALGPRMPVQEPIPPSITPAHRPRTMSEIEAEAIRSAIEWNGGNLVRAARELRIGRATLYRKLKKYGIPTRTQRREMAR
jgi:two-component system response regulator PilR (NtrC family)